MTFLWGLYAIACWFVQKTGRPGVNSFTTGSGRFYWKLGPVTVYQTEYQIAQRAYSGDPIGIVSSLWIYTAKHATGFGLTRPWAHLRNIELELGGLRYQTETGDLTLNPPARADSRLITIRNTHKAVPVTMTLIAFAEGRKANDEDACANLWINQLAAEQTLRFDASTCENIGRIRYKTVPNGEHSLNRLYGRPEWEASC